MNEIGGEERPVRRLRAATVQFEHRPDDKAYNLPRVEDYVRRAAADGVEVVALPEMCLLGYWHLRRHSADRLHALAEPITGPSVGSVRDMAMSLGLAVGAGFLEIDETGRLFNSYAMCLPDGQVHRHRKLHAFEHEAISSGDQYTVFDTPWGVRMGILICWDNNLIENVRATALMGASVLVSPHQTGGTASRSPHATKPDPAGDLERSARRPVGHRGGVSRPERTGVAAALVARAGP